MAPVTIPMEDKLCFPIFLLIIGFNLSIRISYNFLFSIVVCSCKSFAPGLLVCTKINKPNFGIYSSKAFNVSIPSQGLIVIASHGYGDDLEKIAFAYALFVEPISPLLQSIIQIMCFSFIK